jgi:murein DD-endopeptidase MepM/ murein hydrolase activator NlpD
MTGPATPVLVEIDGPRTLELDHGVAAARGLEGLGAVDSLPQVQWPTMWSWPLTTPPAPPTSAFGPRWGSHHDGVDLEARTGDQVVAAASGRVVLAGPQGTLGLAVELDHGNGWATRYGHLSALSVEQGEQVNQGQPLGQAGATGRATGPHLHLEFRRHGEAVDPCLGLRTEQGLPACRPAPPCGDGVCAVGGLR